MFNSTYFAECVSCSNLISTHMKWVLRRRMDLCTVQHFFLIQYCLCITLLLIELCGLSGVWFAATSSFCIWALKILLFWLMLMAHEWERSSNAMCCPCLYVLSAWMRVFFTPTILTGKNHLAIHWPTIHCCFQKLTLNRYQSMAVYIWKACSLLQRWEIACIMTSGYFMFAKSDFMPDWKLLDAMNDNDGSSYSFSTGKKKKKEMHTHHVRNTSNIQGAHGIEVKGTTHLLFSWEIDHKITVTRQNVVACGKPLLQNAVVHIAYSVNPLMLGSVISQRYYIIFDLGEISGFFRTCSQGFGWITQVFCSGFFLTWAG